MKRKYLYIIIGVLVLVFVGLIGYYNISYKNKWYTNTTINGIDVSGLTLQQSKDKIQKGLDSYTLTVKGRNNGSLTINGDDIDYKATVSSKIDSTFKQAHSGIAFPFGSHTYKLVHDVTYNTSKLAKVISSSRLVKGDSTYKINAPLPTRVAYDSSKKQFAILKAYKGNTIDTDGLTKTVEKSLKAIEKTLDVSKSAYDSCYKTVANPSTSELQSRLNAYNNVGLRYITWNMGDKHYETLDPATLSQMLVYQDGKVTVDEKKLSDWVEKLCLKYKTVGQKRTYTSHTGKKLSTTEGDFGWRVDYDKTIAQAKKAVATTIEQSKTDAYMKDASDANKKAITLSYDINWYSTSYKKNWNNWKDDWDGKNYVEVDLAEQRVYVFKNGKVTFSCNCISGKPVPGRKTTTGAFFLKEHQANRTLVGEGYTTPVQWWTRITWTGTGFHAAPWQAWGSWSPSYYKSRGSHGCINLSTENAHTIYKITSYREMCFLHY